MKIAIKEKGSDQEKVLEPNIMGRHENWNNRRRYSRIGYWESMARSK